MSRANSALSFFKAHHWLNLVFLFYSVLLLAACGGGGGDNGTTLTDDPVPTLPSRVNYVAGGPGGDPSTTGIIMQNGALTVTTSFYLAGNYTPATKSYSLTLSPVPRFGMLPTGLGFELPIKNPDGGFGFRVDESLQWVNGHPPTSGMFRVIAGDSIQVKINNDIDGAGTPGVDILLEATGDSASLSWPQFEAALNNSGAPTYQREASLAYLTFQYAYTPINRVVENFNTMRTQENTLESAGSGQQVSVPLCSTFNASLGNFFLTWTDGPGDIAGAMGSGDSFGIAVDNCWVDDTANDHDLLYNSGQMQLKTYGESTTPFVLGFDDVVFNDLQITQTQQTGPGLGTTISSTVYNTFSNVTGRDGFYLELTPDVSGTINLVNVVQVTSAAANSIVTPGEIGNTAVSQLAYVLQGTDPSPVDCPYGGTYDYTLSNPSFGVGETMDVTFHDCVQGTATDQTTVNGSYTLTATAFTSTDDLAFNLALNNITTQDTVSTRSINGQMHFSRLVSGIAPNEISSEVSSSLSGQSLDLSESGVTASLSNFSLSGTRSTSGLTLGQPNESFTLQLTGISDSLAGTIVSGFSGPEMTALQAGSMRITAPDNSNVLMSITDVNGTVQLLLDSDGNGSAEDTVMTTWSDLY